MPGSSSAPCHLMFSLWHLKIMLKIKIITGCSNKDPMFDFFVQLGFTAHFVMPASNQSAALLEGWETPIRTGQLRQVVLVDCNFIMTQLYRRESCFPSDKTKAFSGLTSKFRPVEDFPQIQHWDIFETMIVLSLPTSFFSFGCAVVCLIDGLPCNATCFQLIL